MRDPYPLQWPAGWERARSRKASSFARTGFAQTRDNLLKQLKMHGARQIVITSNLPTRGDGLPYANARADDPGIAVWWVEQRSDRTAEERVMACDRWKTVGENMHALELSIGALRGLARWGATEMVQRAFAGFALPAAGATAGEASGLPPRNASWAPPWVYGMGLDPLRKDLWSNQATVDDWYRTRARMVHPDRAGGGATEFMAQLNVAKSEADRWFAQQKQNGAG